MTLQEAKERVALLLYSKRFDEIQNSDARLRVMEHAAELYARNKWDEACEAMKGVICDVCGISGISVDQATNPEFKP